MKKLFYSMLMLCAMFATTNVSAQEAEVIFEETFETSMGAFTVEGDDVWSWTAERTTPAVKMSPAGKTITDGKTYLVSPTISNGTQTTLTFNHRVAGLFGGGFEEVGKVCVREAGSSAWTVLEGVTFPSKMQQMSGTEVASGDITIPAEFDYKDIQIAFCADPIDASYSGNWFVNAIKVTSVPDKPVSKFYAENIASFNTICTAEGANVDLLLTDAQVLYVNQYTDKKGNEHQEVFVRDATGSTMFYNLGLTVEAGDIMNGLAFGGIAKDYKGIKEFCASPETSFSGVEITKGEVAAAEKTIAEIATEDVSNLVLVKGVTMIAKETTDSKGKVRTNYYLTDAEGNELAYYNKFHVEGLDAQDFIGLESHIFVGIITVFNDNLQLVPTEKAVPTSIDCIQNVELDVNAPMFNVAGQKVNAGYKGIVLQNGKKFVSNK